MNPCLVLILERCTDLTDSSHPHRAHQLRQVMGHIPHSTHPTAVGLQNIDQHDKSIRDLEPSPILHAFLRSPRLCPSGGATKSLKIAGQQGLLVLLSCPLQSWRSPTSQDDRHTHGRRHGRAWPIMRPGSCRCLRCSQSITLTIRTSPRPQSTRAVHLRRVLDMPIVDLLRSISATARTQIDEHRD
ncbi:hypothetical protein FA95DRAFT_128790 [Auriscalpium vulgare]|uniref:Uncharacterized protein n=1 Tax=Auriscalpium vulgare TaxID=40419 RepID=A0ACB8RMQ9_9AGAM|nr:hypothetical protein FA95DRAFT_128790 [Auriscalpium vulgare]